MIAHTVVIGMIVVRGLEDVAHMVVAETLVEHQGQTHASVMGTTGEAVHLGALEGATLTQAAQVQYPKFL